MKIKAFSLIFVIIFFSCERNDLYKFATDGSYDYNLRDVGPAGGWIFYINPNAETDGWKYLEASAVDLSSTELWFSSYTLIGVTAQGTAIGTGPGNTTAIISDVSHTTSAAGICSNYNGGGKSDWFLPSQDELNQMWLNLKEGTGYTPVGGLLNAVYWSSTESSSLNACIQDFSNGAMSTDSKMVGTYVTRAVRRF